MLWCYLKGGPSRLLTTAGCEIAPCALSPYVSVADHIFSWCTPFTKVHDTEIAAALPPPLANYARMSIMGALALKTRSSYGVGILCFTQFCDKWHIPENARMPVSPYLLYAFIDSYHGFTPGKTIKLWMSGICDFHLACHAPWHGNDTWVRWVYSAANKETLQNLVHAPHAPVSIEHPLALKAAINISTPFHAAIWATTLFTFFGCCRLGETLVVGPTEFSCNPSHHVTCSVLYVPSINSP